MILKFKAFVYACISGSVMSLCPNLLDPTQNKNVPFKLWDPTNRVGYKYSGLITNGPVAYQLWLTTTTDRSQAITAEYLPSLHCVDAYSPLNWLTVRYTRFGLYFSGVLEYYDFALIYITPSGEFITPGCEATEGYISFDSIGNVIRTMDKTLAFRIDNSALLVYPVDLTATSATYFVDKN